MPQPKSSRSSTSRASASGARKPAAADKPAASSRSATARKPAAKRAAAKPAAAKPAVTLDARTHANLSALRDTLRRGAVLTQDGLKSALDDAVRRGRLTRKDANELRQAILAAGRKQADDFRADLERLVGHGRSRAAQSSDRMLREVDRARRRVGVGPSFPISLYDELTATQVQARLRDLTPAQLRKVRDYEKRHGNRKSVLSAIERKLS
jgi:hypothetical protein